MASPAAKPQDELRLALRQLRSAFVTVAIFSGCLNVMLLAPALYMMQVYDRVLGSRNEVTLLVLTVLIVGAYAFMSGLETIRSWVLVRVGARLDVLLGLRTLRATFERVLRQPGNSTSQPLYDLATLRQTLTGPGLLAILDAPWSPIYLIVIALFSSEAALLTLAGGVVLLLLTLLNERLAKNPLAQAQQVSMQAQRDLSSHLQNAEAIEAMGMLGGIAQRWQKLHHQEIALQSRASDRAALVGGLSKFVRVSMQSLTLGLGAMLVLEGKITSGMMIAISMMTSRALSPTEVLVGHWRQLVSARGAYARLKDLLAHYPARVDVMSLPAPTGQVSFEGVVAAAPGARQAIIKQISFTLQAGDAVAVIGASGAGKSTLARLLVGVWPALSGTVRLDGADLFRWNKEELGPHIGYLPQDIELFDGSVAENIARFGVVNAEQVVQAAQRVGVHEQILRLPQGYDTLVGPGGSALSGGQRQRIALARALYGDPVLVVLDEPNSNLDEQGEKALADAIADLTQRKRTAMLITHRPAALTVTNKLMVLREGTIAAFGPREEVLAALQGRAAQMGLAPSPAPQSAPQPTPAPNRPPQGLTPPVLVKVSDRQATPPPAAPPAAALASAEDAQDEASGPPPFTLKFND
jgi:ATP-binding cassette, subfamily C, bacterial exporter for protease/lipase